jgi:hypothetical protein
VAVFGPIVHPAAHLTAVDFAEFAHGCRVRSHTISNEFFGSTMALQRLFQKRQSSNFISLSRGKALKNLALMVNRAP